MFLEKVRVRMSFETMVMGAIVVSLALGVWSIGTEIRLAIREKRSDGDRVNGDDDG